MSTPTPEARIERRDSTLVLSGRLDAAGVTALGDDGDTRCSDVSVIDISAVEGLDSTGVALVADLVARCEHRNRARPAVDGRPAGLEELCRAYRIASDFSDFP